jgi:capsular polysaccharide biosynthesis protein
VQDRLSEQANDTSVGAIGPAASAGQQRSDPHQPARLMPSGSISRMIVRRWKRIALVTVAVTAIAWSLAALQPPRYLASCLASVGPLANAMQANELLRSVEVLERRTIVATVAALASTSVTRGRVGAGRDYEIRAVVLPNTNLFRIEVEGGNALQTTAIANRVPAVMSAQTEALYKYYTVVVISPAIAPDAPFLPRTGRAIAAGLLIGLFLGLVAALADLSRFARGENAMT